MKALRRESLRTATSTAARSTAATEPGSRRDQEGLIIQCPACQARFALTAAALEGIEQPRFHCSRCDHIFSREEFPAPELVADPTVMDDQDDEFSEAEPPLEEQDMNAEVSSEPEAWTTGWSLLEQSSTAHSLTIPHTFSERLSTQAPQESAAEGFPLDDAEQMTFDFGNRDTGSPSFNFRFGTTAAPVEPAEVPPYREPLSFTMGDLPPELLPSKGPSVWRPVLLVAAPLLVLLTVLVAASYFLRTNPVLTSSLSEKYLSNAPQVAPPGLIIRDLKFRNVALESGESIQLVSGTLENHTERSFKEVIIEALAFDRSGKEVVSQRVNAASTFSKTKIKSFTIDMIEELQARNPVRKLVLQAGDRQEFAIALTSTRMSEARYYSARIYSVQ